MKKQPFARKPMPLTDRSACCALTAVVSVLIKGAVWANIRDEVIQWVTEQRDLELRSRRSVVMNPRFDAFQKYLDEWAKGDNWPSPDRWDDDPPLSSNVLSVVDYLLIPEVRDILNASHSDPLSRDDFAGTLGPKLPALVIRWGRARKRELTAFLRKSLGPSPADRVDDPLALAAFTFDCDYKDSICHGEFMRFPDVLDHRCVMTLWNEQSSYPVFSYENMVLEWARQRDVRSCWSTAHIRVNQRVTPRKIFAIIRACGLDPFTATYDDMWACKTRMTCGECSVRGPNDAGGYQVFNWKGAVGIFSARSMCTGALLILEVKLLHQDCAKHFDMKRPCNWIVLPEEIGVRVRNFEVAAKKTGSEFRRYIKFIRCPECCSCYAVCRVQDQDKLLKHFMDK